MHKNASEDRKAIFNSISKHPNTRFAKLFHEVDALPSQKNIVLLLIELTQQKDFYVDFNISLQYFLNLYEQLDANNREFLFNETGLLIYNAVQVYSRRVDCVQDRVEYQLAELSSGQENKEKNPSDDSTPETITEKPKRRKRIVETTDPYEIEVVSRKFRMLTPAKRFIPGTKMDTSKLYSHNLHAETYTHPALWQHSEIIDLDNDEEFDSKRNYRLFTYHLEHRYNTLVPDINFRLYFKMKDFIDEEDERDGESEFCHQSEWPPLSQAYVKRYIDLEDQVLAKDKIIVKKDYKDRKRRISRSSMNNTDNGEYSKLSKPSDSGIGSSFLDTSLEEFNDSQNESDLTQKLNSSKESQADSGFDSSFLQLSNADGEEHSIELSSLIECGNAENTSNQNAKEEGNEKSKDELTDSIDLENQELTNTRTNIDDKVQTEIVTEKPNENENNINEITTTEESDANKTDVAENSERIDEETLKDTKLDETGKENADDTIELTVRIESDKTENCVTTSSCASLSPTNDEGVYLSDIDDTPSIPFTIHLNKTTTFQLNEENGKEMYALPVEKEPIEWPIVLNILEFPKSVLKKMRKKRLLTNLGEDMELFLKSRSLKRTRNVAGEQSPNPRRIKLNMYGENSPSNEYFHSRCDSPQSEIDLLGFLNDFDMVTQCSLEGIKTVDLHKSPTKNYKNIRLSRDSGVENDLQTASPEKSTMFFPPIEEQDEEEEELKENEEILENPSDQNRSENLEILSNVLLPPLNTLPSSLTTAVESCDTQNPEDCNLKMEEINNHEREENTPNDNISRISNSKFPSMDEDSDSEHLSNCREQNFELSGDTAAKIQRWHKHLQPILANSRDRHHFDVFQIGTNIINEFEEQSNTKSISFQNVMEHQDPSYVSRYFLSTLLLANQGNIELSITNKSENSPTEWHDMHLKLLSKTRHVVSMEDNIGLAAIKAPISTIVPKVKVQTSKSKKRSVSTLNVDVNFDLNSIEIVKPITKIIRNSIDYDSGIYSNDDLEYL